MRKKIISCLSGILMGCLLIAGSHTTVCAASEENNVSHAESEVANADSPLDENGEIPIDGFSGENLTAAEYVTGMDEDGNIYELVEEEPTSLKALGIEMYTNNPFFVNFNIKSSTQITEYKEVDTGIEGYISGVYAADGIYLGEVDGKVKFMMSGVIGLVAKSDVELVAKENALSYNFYEVVDGILIHRITTNIYASSYSSNLRNGPAPSYLKAGTKYYSYDGHYFYTNLEKMVADYNAGHRNNSVNSSKPFYNYYQYLPFRSYSSYSADEMTSILNSRVSATSKLRNLGSTFIQMQNTYGTNALLVAGIAANESGWGTTNICQTKNNLFGINAVDATPGQSAYYYPSTAACVEDYTERFMSRQYFNPDNWKYRGAFLGNKASGMNLNYASDPYWGEKAAAIAWQLDGYGSNQDQFLYTIGVKDPISSKHTNLNIRKEATTSSDIIYTTKNQASHTFLILDPVSVNRFYKIQSEPVLKYGRTGIASGVGTYNKYAMYLYASSDYVTIVSEGTKKDVNQIKFSDVPKNQWYYTAVNYAVQNGIMTGMTETVFAPNSILTRVQLPVLLYRLESSPTVSYVKKYVDVADNTWYTDAIIWATDKGIVNGYTNSLFGVNDNITREQMAVMLYRYAKYKNYNVSKQSSIAGFTDANKVSSYAKEAMSWAVGTGIIQGKENGKKLDPQGFASRAEGATVTMRFDQYYR